MNQEKIDHSSTINQILFSKIGNVFCYNHLIKNKTGKPKTPKSKTIRL